MTDKDHSTVALLTEALQEKAHLVLLCGLSGCGKTMFANRLSAVVPDLWVVSTDAIWERVGWYPTWQERQSECYKRARARARTGLGLCQPVMIDAMLIEMRHRAEFVRVARGVGAEASCVYWPPDVETSVRRRPKVAPKKIRQWALRYVQPETTEGFCMVLDATAKGEQH